MNQVTIIGRLGKDPEVKFITNGNAVCNLSVATSEKYTDKAGNKVENTEWHNVTAWGKTAEICGKYLAKGRQVAITGKLKTEKYQKDGQDRFATKIIAEHVEFLGDGQRYAGAPADDDATPDAGDIPF